VAQVTSGALRGEALVHFSHSDGFTWIALLWQSLYFTTTTFATVGYGDIVPSNILGEAVSFLIQIQAFVVISIVIASLFAAKDR
jgi:hypothetical protein